MRIDGLVDGGTHISYNKPAKTVHMYMTRHLRQNKDKTPLRMRIDGLVDGGTHLSYHKPAKTVRMYMTLDLRQKQGQNAIAHAY